MNKTFDTRVLLGIGLVVLTLIGSIGVAIYHTRKLYDDAQWVSHSHDVIDLTDGVLLLVTDAETGQRGYLITGDEPYLQPYHEAVAKLDRQLTLLKGRTVDNPHQQERTEVLKQLVMRRMNILEENRRKRTDEGFESARQSILADDGRKAMQAIRAHVAEMIGEERALMDDRTGRFQQRFRIALITALVTAGLGLAMVAVFVTLLDRSLRDRAQAAATIHREREYLRTTLASIGDGVIVTDDRGRVTLLNEVAETLTGWKQPDAGGKALDVVFHIVNETTRQSVDNPALRSLREGKIVGLANHTVLIARDGVERAIADSAAPIRDQEGQILGAVLVFRDVSDDRAAERALEASEARKSAILQTALDSIITCDQDGRVVEFNPAAERTFGYARESVLGKDLADLIVPERFRRPHRQGLRHYLATGEGPLLNQRVELAAVRADGSEFVAELSITRIPGDGPPMFTAYLRDITERKEAEKELLDLTEISERSRRLYETIFATIPDLIYVFDLNHRFIYANKALLEMWGRSWDDAVGKNCLELGYEPWHAAMHDQEIDHVVATKAPLRNEVPFTGTQGTRIYDYIFVPVLAADGSVEAVAGTTRDITEHKQLEEHLRQVAAELSEANRRKTEFLATLAHELRNPLAPIRTGLELLKIVRDDPLVVEETRSMMERQALQMVRLIDDLLDISRITQGKLQLRKAHIELSEVVRNSVEAVRPFMEESRHDFQVTLPETPIYLEADPNRLAQVVSNLLNNAAKYTKEGGQIRLNVTAEDGEACISVKDNGLGIPPEMRDRIFEMFAQIDRPLERGYTGLGIGLTLVKRLVEMHNGTVEVFSEDTGQGSEFRVRLPLVAESPPAHDNNHGGALVAHDATAYRILVVDDNKAAAEMLGAVLKLFGNEVKLAHDGLKAVETAEEFRPDIVLMDLGMPGLNGYEAAQHIRKEPWGRDIVLAALTGWGQDEDRRRTKEAGFDYHLIKPAEPAELRRLLSGIPRRSKN